MALVIGFDVYGTLVDPLGMQTALASVVGDAHAAAAAQLWRTKQIEYAFRRALMAAYQDFAVCTRDALRFTLAAHGVPVADDVERVLLEHYLRLPAFADVAEGLRALRGLGATMLAFSNGLERDVRTVLSNAGLLDLFDGVVSVDDLRTFKPDPAVYRYLVDRGGAPESETWLVSSNGWDVIGAKAAGLRAAWLDRAGTTLFDPWEFRPDAVIRTLGEVSSHLAL
jgi:2-haloacid dehalogenase